MISSSRDALKATFQSLAFFGFSRTETLASTG